MCRSGPLEQAHRADVVTSGAGGGQVPRGCYMWSSRSALKFSFLFLFIVLIVLALLNTISFCILVLYISTSIRFKRGRGEKANRVSGTPF